MGVPEDHAIPQRSLSAVSLHPSPPSTGGRPWTSRDGGGFREPSPARSWLLFFKGKSLDLSCSGAAFLLGWINLKQRRKFFTKSPWEGNRWWKSSTGGPIYRSKWFAVAAEGAGDGVWGEEGGCWARTLWDGTSGRDDAVPEQTHPCSHRGGKGLGLSREMQPFLS